MSCSSFPSVASRHRYGVSGDFRCCRYPSSPATEPPVIGRARYGMGQSSIFGRSPDPLLGREMANIVADSALEARGLVMQSIIHPSPILTRLALTVAVAMLLMVPISHATADTLVVDLPLEDGGSQRVLYASPANPPRAALVMLPGGNGIVEIGNDGSIRRMGG